MAAPVAVVSTAWSTALGSEIDEVWQKLLRGETGFVSVSDPFRLRNDLAAVVPQCSSEETPAARLRRLAETTIRRALTDTPWRPDSTNPPIDLVLGTSLGDFLEPGASVGDLHSWAEEVAAALGTSGQVISLSTACSSSADAILVGAELIRSGASQICVCGGADVVSSVKRQGHSTLGTLSPTRLRPLDAQREGTLLGEGAAFLVLCSGDLIRPATKRGKSGTDWLLGAGSANDGASMSGPDPAGRGACLAIERALADAGISTAEIGVINAHGSGTPLNDDTEVAVYRELFPAAQRVSIFATKGAFGHTLGATGAMEALALLQSLRRCEIPPIAGLDQPLPEATSFRLPVSEPLSVEARYGLSLTLGFGGFDTALVFERRPAEAAR